MAPLPLSARPRDWFFVVVFAAFALTSFLVDTLPALGWSTFMHDALVASYADCDPMFMRPPPFLLVAATVSGFVWGPLYCWLVWGFVRGRAVIRVPALLYAGALTLAMLMIFAEELGSPVPGWASSRPWKFAAYNLPYLIVPMLTGLRMWRPYPFGARASGKPGSTTTDGCTSPSRRIPTCCARSRLTPSSPGSPRSGQDAWRLHSAELVVTGLD